MDIVASSPGAAAFVAHLPNLVDVLSGGKNAAIWHAGIKQKDHVVVAGRRGRGRQSGGGFQHQGAGLRIEAGRDKEALAFRNTTACTCAQNQNTPNG